MEKKIINVLLDDAAYSAIVGTKVRPNFGAAADAPPYATVRRVGGGRYNTLNGGSTQTDTLIEIAHIGTTYKQAKDMAIAAETALNGYSDKATSPLIYMVHLEDETDDDFSPSDGGDYVFHRVIQDYNVSFDTGA